MSLISWERAYKKLHILVVAAGCILSFAAANWQLQSNKEKYISRFEKDAFIRSEVIRKQFEIAVNNQFLLKAFFENSDYVSKKEFDNFCSTLSAKENAYTYIWALKKGGTIQFKYVYPEADFEEYSKNHKACLEAFESFEGGIGSSAVISGYCGNSHIRLISSVLVRGAVTGVLITGISIDYLLKRGIDPMPPINMPVRVYHEGKGAGVEIYKWQPRLSDDKAGLRYPDLFFPKIPRHESSFSTASGKFVFIIEPGNVYMKKNFSQSHIMVLFLLLLLTAGVSKYVHKSIREKEKVETLAKEIGEKLFEKTKELDKFFEIANDMFAFASNDGRFLRLSREWERALGYRMEDLNGAVFMDYVHPEDIEETKNAMEILSEKKPLMNFVNRYRCKDGTYKYIEWRSVTPDGKLIYASARDITERKNYEKMLEEREYWLKESQKAGKIGSYNFNVVDDSWYCTEALDEIFGIRESFPRTYKSWGELLFDDDRKMMNEYFASLIEKGGQEPFDKEYRIKRKSDGAVRWVYGKGVFVVNKGVVERMIGTISDVTEQAEYKLALKSSEALYNSLVETAHDLIWRCDAEGKYVYVNKAWEEAVGYKVDEITGKKFIDFMRPDDASRDMETFGRLMKEEGHVYNYETVHIRKNGETANLVFNAVSVKDSSGRVIGTQGTAQDITLRKIAERKLKESERKIRSIIDGMAEGVALHEYVLKGGVPVDYRIIDVNRSYEMIVGVNKSDIAGKLSSEAYGTNEPPYLTEFSKVFTSKSHYLFETYFSPMGKYFSISVAPWGENGFATIFTDITLRKKSEEEREKMIRELEAKNAEMESFLYTVSHDLKTPLVTVSGFSSLLELKAAEKLGPEEKEYLELIKTSVNAMKGLLDGVLTVSRAGRLITTEKGVKMAEVIKEAVKITNGVIKQKNGSVRIVQAQGAHLDPVVEGDRKKLSEVFQNLITNAVKFTPEGIRPEIEIRIEKDETDGRSIYSVKDNGVGIEPKYISKIFGLFERLDESVEGTGIGLAIVKRIVELHGGKVWAESEGKNRGSVFKFKI